MLGAKKVKSQKVPVVFDPMMAASFIGGIAGAVNGDAVYKKASFLASRLGQPIAPATVTIVDDGLMPRGLATSPFDGEGVPTRRSPIVDKGVLTTFLYDAFTARKAKTRSTGNASRGYRSLPSIGTHNLYLEPGTRSPEQLIKDVSHGFYVTSMLGHGTNLVTGDYSRGATGLWFLWQLSRRRSGFGGLRGTSYRCGAAGIGAGDTPSPPAVQRPYPDGQRSGRHWLLCPRVPVPAHP